MEREALKLCLEYIETNAHERKHVRHAIQAALARPAQEPVGYEHHEYRPFGAPGEIRIHAILKSQYLLPDELVAGDFQWLINQYKADKNTIKLQPLYTAPPQRKWVGLTDEETSGFTQHEMTVVKYVSKVLQEKNT